MTTTYSWAAPTTRVDGTALAGSEILGYSIQQEIADTDVYYYESASPSYDVPDFSGDYGTVSVAAITDGYQYSEYQEVTAGGGADTVPNPQAIPDSAPQEPGALGVESDAYLITGMGDGVETNAGDGSTSYRVDAGGGFGAVTTTITPVQNGYYVRNVGDAGSNFGDVVPVVLPIGGVDFTFNIVTRDEIPTSMPATRSITVTVGVTTIGTLSATGEIPITYSKTGGADAALFNVSSGGALTAAAPLDTLGDYVVTVQASSSSGTASQTITVHVVAGGGVQTTRFKANFF